MGHLHRMPLFVDMRWARDHALLDLANPEFKRSVNAIVARLRGVDPNELAGIEISLHRKNVRLRNVVVVALAVPY